MFESFHFLRPEWLLALLVSAAFFFVVRFSSQERQWRRLIAPHLLRHLKVSAGGGFFVRPLHLITALTTLGAVGLAGPTWERERSPFAEDRAPLVVALDVSVTMNAIDVQPTRLERAKQKIRDLLSGREGGRTALIAYAGSAHTVLPLSDDASIFETFLSALSTSVMPIEGQDPSRALALAEELLSGEETPGSILFFTDRMPTDSVAAFVDHRDRSLDSVMVLAVGTSEGGPIRKGDSDFETDGSGRRLVPKLDTESLNRFSSETGAFVASVTVGDEDVERVGRRIQTDLQAAREEDETARWRDVGYYVSFPVALLGVLWFRKGWTVRIGVAVLLLMPGCSADVWLTPDQQGRRAYEGGDFEAAASRFEEPMWRGVASYRAGEYESAIEAFARVDSADAYFNVGDAYMQLEDYERAASNFETALAMRAGWPEAEDNLALARALIPREPDEETEQGGDATFSADEVQFDDKADQGTEGEVEMTALTDEQLQEMWMRRLTDSPAAFLRRRFAIETALSAEAEPR